MEHYQLLSRRNGAAVDFRPSTRDGGPAAQLRRLAMYLEQRVPSPDTLTGCDDAIRYLREYTYRKVFTGTSHQEFCDLDSTPEGSEAIDWLIAVHEVDQRAFKSRGERPRAPAVQTKTRGY